MILPIRAQNGQKAAQGQNLSTQAVEMTRNHANMDHVEHGLVRVRSCNSVFRYPSPFGWSCGVPAGSPVFSSQAVAYNAVRMSGGMPGRSEETGKCQKFGNSLLPAWPLLGWRAVETHSVSRRSSVRAPVRPRQPLSGAASLRVRLSGAPQTSSIARKTLASADRLNSSARFGLIENEHAICALSGAGGFFVANSGATVSRGTRTRRDMTCSTRS